MSETKIPTPPAMGMGETESFEIPQSLKKESVCCVIRGHKGIPIDAKLFAELIRVQVKLLESIGKNMDLKEQIIWCITEAAIIGEDGAFTLTGYSKDSYRKELAKAKRAVKQPPHAGA